MNEMHENKYNTDSRNMEMIKDCSNTEVYEQIVTGFYMNVSSGAKGSERVIWAELNAK